MERVTQRVSHTVNHSLRTATWSSNMANTLLFVGQFSAFQRSQCVESREDLQAT